MTSHCVLTWPLQDITPRELGPSLETSLIFASFKVESTSDSNHSKIPVYIILEIGILVQTSFQFNIGLIAFCGHSEDVLQKQQTFHSETDQALPRKWRSWRSGGSLSSSRSASREVKSTGGTVPRAPRSSHTAAGVSSLLCLGGENSLL